MADISGLDLRRPRSSSDQLATERFTVLPLGLRRWGVPGVSTTGLPERQHVAVARPVEWAVAGQVAAGQLDACSGHKIGPLGQVVPVTGDRLGPGVGVGSLRTGCQTGWAGRPSSYSAAGTHRLPAPTASATARTWRETHRLPPRSTHRRRCAALALLSWESAPASSGLNRDEPGCYHLVFVGSSRLRVNL